MGYISRSYSEDHGEYYQKKGGCKKDHDKKDRCHDKEGRTVVDFDFSNQSGAVTLATAAILGAIAPEQVIGDVDFDTACNGDLVWLSGSSTITAPVAVAVGTTIVYRIHKVRRFQNDPLLGTVIHTVTQPLPALTVGEAIIVPIDFVDVLNSREDGVSYVLTVGGTAVLAVALSATISNTTFTGTQYSQ